MSIYHDLILDHYRNPRNFGKLPNADISIREENVGCGDEIEIQLQVTSDRRQVKAIKWNGRGCAVATAAASLLSERIGQMRQISHMRQMSDHDLVAFLGGDISPSRMKCATLGLRALQKAIEKLETDKHTTL